jgi:hypothetical protein
MEQLKEVLKELNLVDVDAHSMDEIQELNVRELIFEKIEGEIAELGPDINTPEFVLDSVLSALTLYYMALHQIDNPIIKFEQLEVSYVDVGVASLYYKDFGRVTDPGEINEFLARDQNLDVWLGKYRVILRPENLDTIMQGIMQAEDAHKAPEQADELQPYAMTVDKFMADYGLWVGQCLSEPTIRPENIAPKAYVQEFASMAWLPERKEMKDFLMSFSGESDVDEFMDATFVWE